MILPIKQAGRSVTKDRTEALDNILTYLFMSEQKEWSWCSNASKKGWDAILAFNKLPLTHFDGADVSMLYESLEETTSYQREFFSAETNENIDELRRLEPSWDRTFAGYDPGALEMYSSEFEDHSYLFSLARRRTVPLKSVRGLFRLRSGIVLEESQAHLRTNGTYFCFRSYMQYFSGTWHIVGIPYELHPPERLDEQTSRYIWMDRSACLTSEYDWSVHIGFNVKSVPTISIPSDPIGAREVFRFRDMPPGKDRREALKHWVRGHTRKALPPNYAETYIWPYLRGAEEFTWNGLYCKIQPSQYDLIKAKQYQLMRKKQSATAC